MTRVMHSSDSFTSYVETVEILEKAHKDMVKGNIRSNQLYFPLEAISFEMAGALFMTNYDIQKIQETYLKLWELDTRKSYVLLQSLTHYFDHDYYGIISNFFTKKTFNCYEFFIFVCFFSFFNINSQIQLLLSMSKIYSNLIITKEQINSFFKEYQTKKILRDDIVENLTKMMENEAGYPKDTYSIKSFISVLQAHPKFTNYLYQFKQVVINFVFTPFDYMRIFRRITFYYDDNMQNLKPPKERCCDYLHRVVFTKQPHPYAFDYFPNNCDIKDVKSNMVFMMKRRYGYSSRVESLSNNQSNLQRETSLKRTLKSFRCNDTTITSSSPYSLGSVRLNLKQSIRGYKCSNNVNNSSIFPIKTKTTI